MSLNFKPIPVHIRWLIRRDLPELLDIESRSFDRPWADHDFIRHQRRRNCIGMVGEAPARRNGKRIDAVLAYMVYELRKREIILVRLAVHPRGRRRTIGGQMLAELTAKLSYQRRRRIVVHVRETDLPAQLFFRDQGFRATAIEPRYFFDTDEDAFVMQYQVRRRLAVRPDLDEKAAG